MYQGQHYRMCCSSQHNYILQPCSAQQHSAALLCIIAFCSLVLHTTAFCSLFLQACLLTHAAKVGTVASNPVISKLQRAAKGMTDRAQRLLQPKQGSKQEEEGKDAEARAGMRDAMSRAEAAMSQAESLLRQVDQAAEELVIKVGSNTLINSKYISE